MVDNDGRSRFRALHHMQDKAILVAKSTDPPQYGGDGVVMVAGSGRHFVNAYVSLAILREDVKCQLPIQVWHLGVEDMSPHMASLLDRFDVEVVDASEVKTSHPIRKLGGWECKPYALLHSRFERAILLDADNFALRDPSFLLECEELRSTGALFWPDITTAPEDSLQWDVFGVPYRKEPEFESGQVVVDKSQSWLPLNLAVHYCSWSDIYWQYINGDKQAFQMAWRYIDQPYSLCPHPVQHLAGHVVTPLGRQRWRVAFEQHDFDGEPLFHHRVGSEWVLFGTNVEVVGAAKLDFRCKRVLEDLRTLWDGRIQTDPPRPAGLDQHDPAHVHWYRYRRIGISERTIELDSDGEYRVTGMNDGGKWRIEENEGARQLVLTQDTFDACRLTLDPDGIWRGRWTYFEQGPVELVPLPDFGERQ